MISRPRTAALLSVLLVAPAAAQLARPGQPASARHPHLFSGDLPAVLLPHPDIERLMLEDEQRGQWPFRYGAAIPTALSCDESGSWDQLPSGELVWRLHIASPGALSLGVLFHEYDLPAGAELYLYDPAPRSTTPALGAYTRETRQPNGMLAVQPLLGDELVIEYVQPALVAGRPRLRLGEVVHDYRGILDRLRFESPIGLGSGGCLVDVNCPQGAAWQDVKRSVLFMLFSGTFCSAGLLNNTASDATPYFLTANHCGDMTNVVAVFGYENTGCGPGGASQSNTISGATLLAASANYDSQLYRLSSSPPQSFAPFFAGWDRGSAGMPAPGISISHPSGFPKKIARDDDSPFVSGTRWLVTWELGRLEGGSSGSPLFSGAKRVLGPACCVTNFTCTGQWAYYGRIGGFWEQQGLGQWLDPLGADPAGIDGYDPYQPIAVFYNGSGTNLSAYTSTTPPGVGSTWNAAVDTTAIPFTTSTWIVGYPAPDSGVFLALGELLVDLATPRLFRSVAPVSGGTSTHSNTIPSDPALVGFVAYTQAILFGGGGPLTLTNGLELRLR